MKYSLAAFSLFFLCCLNHTDLFAQLPVLGSYPNAEMTSGQNVVITPSAVPSNTLRTEAQAGHNFTGSLYVDPVSGEVAIVNAGVAGFYTVTVKAFNSFGVTSQNFSLTVNDPDCSQGKFTAATIYPVGGPSNEHNGMVVDDFNGDGHQDIAVLDRWDIITDPESYIVTIMEGDGAGGFVEGSITAIASSPNEIVAADFNGDGAADLAISHESVSVYLNDGSGSFSLFTDITQLGIYGLATADFNNDAIPDLAISSQVTNSVRTWLGDGTGNFNFAGSFSTPGIAEKIATGDINADGFVDLVSAIPVGGAFIAIRLGNGTGIFTGSTNIATGSIPFLVRLADFNEDGKLDIVFSNHTNAPAKICFGDGVGGFGTPVSLAAFGNAATVVNADFNGDGHQDLVISRTASTSDVFSVLAGTGTGTFTLAHQTNSNYFCTFIEEGDFNEDNKFDFAALSFIAGYDLQISLASVNDIQLTGNATLIPDGDTSPSLVDGTQFSSVCLGSPSLTQQFSIMNVGTNDLILGSGSFVFVGIDAANFSITGIVLPKTITPNSSTTFNVVFNPSSAGLKTSSLQITSDDCDETIYDFVLNGQAIAPLQYYIDADADGFGSALDLGLSSCSPITGYVVNNTDCDDLNNAIRPTATEICNSTDDNCNLLIDEGLATSSYYYDADGDGYGSTLLGAFCAAPANASSLNGDCNDANNLVHPGSTEVCNTVDDNCNTQVDEDLTTTTYYLDADGDGYGLTSLGSFCAPPVGGVTVAGDCNDGNAAISPNATELCNTVDDDCDGLTDEGCPANTPANDNVGNAMFVAYSSNLNFPNCYSIIGSCQSATHSVQAPFTSPDVWYSFIAYSNAVSITVSSNGMDDALALFSLSGSTYTLVDSENLSSGNADFERMNFIGLNVGTTYYLCVAAANGIATSNFSLCIQHLMPSGCATPQSVGGFSLCQNFKAIFRGSASQGVTYGFNFTGIGGTASGISSVSGTNGLIVLSNPLLSVRYGGIYNVQVNVKYALLNSLNQTENITVDGNSSTTNCSAVTVMNVPTMEVKASQRCPATLVRTNYLIATPVPGATAPCGATSYTFEFTSVTNCTGSVTTGLPFEVTTNGTTPYLSLNAVFPSNLLNPGYWKVRVKSNFSYGSGVYGTAPSWIIQVNGTAASTELQDDEIMDGATKSSLELSNSAIYPNPSDGRFLHVNVTDVLSDVIEMKIIDATGKLIMNKLLAVNKNLNTTLLFDQQLESGIYFVRLAYDNQTIVHKLMVE